MTLKQECKAWTLLSVGALAIAGIFALLLVLSRTPIIQDFLPWPWKSFFHKGLVTHVVFSFVVWFLGSMGALMSYSFAQVKGEDEVSKIGSWALGLSSLGCMGLILPALLDLGTAELNNYVPVMNHPLYYAGVVLLMVGLSLVAIRQVFCAVQDQNWRNLQITGTDFCAFIYLIALCCFFLAWLYIPAGLSEPTFNERLFWGGGHVLQFVNTAILFLVWMAIVRNVSKHDLLKLPYVLSAFIILVLFTLPAPMLYPIFDVLGQEHRDFYTDMLRFGLVLPSFIFSIALCVFLISEKSKSLDIVSRHALWLSLLTYNLGGFYGLMLDGTDTRVPAHYHAVIGGINLALMAFYHRVILPFIHVKPELSKWGKRWSVWQYWLYGLGQIMHATGMYLAGSQGVPRKTAGTAQALDSIEKILSMGLMGIGGLIAVMGGVVFVIMTLNWIVKGGRVYETK
jgi:cytochrome c oxidase subunit I